MLSFDFEDPTAVSGDGPKELPDLDRLFLIVLQGPSVGASGFVTRQGGFVGRDQGANLPIRDPYVSRCHLNIIFRDGQFVVEDQGSQFGTYVEGEKVGEQRLRDGDRIQISKHTTLRVRYQDRMEAALEEHIRTAAVTDPLTKVANRRSLIQRLEQEFAYSVRQSELLTVLMIDVDNFKGVNDRFGHLEGDTTLMRLVGVIQQTIRKEDHLARYGGDEFVVVSRGISERAGLNLGRRLGSSVRTGRYQALGQVFPLTVSSGVATFRPREPGRPATVAELLARADAAAYASKRAGRDRCTGWSELPAARLASVTSSATTLG